MTLKARHDWPTGQDGHRIGSRSRTLSILSFTRLVKPAQFCYSDSIKSRPFGLNRCQGFHDSILDVLAFIGGRMINTDFDRDLWSRFLAAHCRFPETLWLDLDKPTGMSC
jgi:hypothetical protein